MFLLPLCLSFVVTVLAAPSPNPRGLAPTVNLDNGSFTGFSDPSTGTNVFLGIPFAQPPVGNLRFQLPQALPPYEGPSSAVAFGPACPQQAISVPLPQSVPQEALTVIVDVLYAVITPASEDCLTLNVWVPEGTKPSDKLPVVAWIFGGGFELGGPSTYDGGVIVERSVQLGEPIIYVSMNYRVSAFGFLASEEVAQAGVGNLGLQDQRLALRWIQKYISAFGGDSTKVTIWGESAGAISVALQMLTNGGDTEGLFRGAFMESGSPIPTSDMSGGQAAYNALVEETGCTGASDTLQCLREVPYEALLVAVDNSPNIFSYESLNLTWVPRVDGVFLTDFPQQLVLQGSVADVPFVTGDCDDEGTLFSLALTNITNENELSNYLATNYFPTAPSSDINTVLEDYPADNTQGSPFDTSNLNALTPEYKRLAAFQGDLIFQSTRRFFLQQRSDKQKTWSFLSKRLKSTPFLGSFHGSDLLNVYGPGDMTDYLINFVNNLDPNSATAFTWPQYDTTTAQMLTFLDGSPPLNITTDTYREEAIAFLESMDQQFP